MAEEKEYKDLFEDEENQNPNVNIDIDYIKEELKEQLVEWFKTPEGIKFLQEKGILQPEKNVENVEVKKEVKVEEKKEAKAEEKGVLQPEKSEVSPERIKELAEIIKEDVDKMDKEFSEVFGDRNDYEAVKKIAISAVPHYSEQLGRLVLPSEVMKELVDIFKKAITAEEVGEILEQLSDISKKVAPSGEGGRTTTEMTLPPGKSLEEIRKQLGLPPKASWMTNTNK